MIRGFKHSIYADCQSKREARLRWRKSAKGKAWDKAYSQRPYVKAKRHEKYLQYIIKKNNEQNTEQAERRLHIG